jgi:hypothetical protein
MPSRQKKLRIPAALAFALLSPGTLSCDSSSSDNCGYCSPLVLPDAGIGDAGASACTGPDDPRLTDPRWQCIGLT